MRTAQRLLITVLFLQVTPTVFSQFNGSKFIDPGDTSAVLNILNGTWKLKIQGEKHEMKFSFDKKGLECVDSVNTHWYTDEFTRYVLNRSNGANIYLREYEFLGDEGLRTENDIWILDKKTVILNIGGDFGVYVIKKKRRD